jgi:raffinose/stachyose/melibiose transport system permease protein
MAHSRRTTVKERPRSTGGSLKRRRKILRGVVIAVFVAYVVTTIVPFYLLIVRTFVPTKKTTQLWLWPPPAEEVNLDADVGNFSVFFNLDIQRFKEEFGLPEAAYLNPKWSFKRVAEEYDVPEEELVAYLTPFVKYNGWMVLLQDKRFFWSIGRTVLMTVGGLIGLNALSILTGTGLAGLNNRFKRSVYNLYIASTAIPFFLIILPQFMLVQGILKLIPGYQEFGSATRRAAQLVAMMLLYARGGALSTMIFTSYISSIPRELEESAEIDGASRWQYIRHIQLPLMKIPVASVTVIHLVWFWNDFLRPFVYLDNNNSNLLILIANSMGQYSTNFQVIYTGVLVSVLPLLIVYILFRRFFIEGAMAGAIKG